MAKLKLIYSEEFRNKCFNNLRFAMDIRLLIAAMDYNHHEVVRYYLESLLDAKDLYIENEISDDGARRVANAKIHAHKVRQELYNEYMELLTNALDLQDAGKKTRLFSERGNL
jgi:hypothetical protein